MIAKEKSILSELRDRSTWEKWGKEFHREFFPSEDARKVRGVIESIHTGSEGPQTIPVEWISSFGVGEIGLDAPLPSDVANVKLRKTYVTMYLNQYLGNFSRKLERGEEVDVQDLKNLKTWIGEVEEKGGPSTDDYSLLSAQELVEGKEWEERGLIPTFLHAKLDEYLGGGIGRGQLCVLGAPWKKGKSTFLMTIAYRAAREGYRTLFLSCENYRDQMGERLDQIHRLSGKEMLPTGLKLQYRHNLSLKDIKRYLEEMGKTDLLILDYFGKMKSESEDQWTGRTMELYTGLRDGIANQQDLVCWTATQTYDPPSWQRGVQRSDVFGSKTQGHLADLILGVKVDQQLNRATFEVLGRRGRGKAGGKFSSYFNADSAELRED